MQYTIKDGHGKAVQDRDRFPNYANVAAEILDSGAALPLTVWKNRHGSQWYDGDRTRKLSDGVRLVYARREAV